MKIALKATCFLLGLLSHTFLFGQISQTKPIEPTSIQTNSLQLSWEWSNAANSFLQYGFTPSFEQGVLSIGNTGTPQVTITNLSPVQLVYARGFAVNGTDTTFSQPGIFITRSLSSGKMLAYFNRSVDHTYSNGTFATQLLNAIDDTLIAYINRATESIDIAIYNFANAPGISNIHTALNNAHNNGVRVRIIYNESSGNSAIPALNPQIPRLESPASVFPGGFGLMHNKFVVFDGNSSNPERAIVWTGSTNWTTQNINTDPNNVVIIHDQSLAKAYTMEFEEMWGGSGLQPNLQNSRFGPQKTDNTPKIFNVGGKRVELYFSPSDGVTQKIIEKINEANHDICLNLNIITRNDIAGALNARHIEGINVFGTINTDQSTSFDILLPVLQNNLAAYREPGLLHHKTMIVDAYHGAGAFVLTGSHNWSNNAENRNDENTIIIYDENIANQFLQEAMSRFAISSAPIANDVSATVGKNMTTPVDVSVTSIFNPFAQLSAQVVSQGFDGIGEGDSNAPIIYYTPSDDFVGTDQLTFLLCNTNFAGTYCSNTANLNLTIDPLFTVDNIELNPELDLFPNPSGGNLNMKFQVSKSGNASLKITNMNGKVIVAERFEVMNGENILQRKLDLQNGTYIATLILSGKKFTRLFNVVN